MDANDLVPYNRYIEEIRDNSDELFTRMRIVFRNGYEVSIIRATNSLMRPEIKNVLDMMGWHDLAKELSPSFKNDPIFDPESEFFEVGVFKDDETTGIIRKASKADILQLIQLVIKEKA